MHPLIDVRRREILDFAARYGVADVRVFGSMAMGNVEESSDVDLLVRLLPGPACWIWGLLMGAQDVLGGRVDVVSEFALNPRIRERVLREAETL